MCVVFRKAIARVDWVVATASTLREKEHKHLATSIAQGASNHSHFVLQFLVGDWNFIWFLISYDTYWHYRNLQKPALMSRSWQQLRPTWADSLSTFRVTRCSCSGCPAQGNQLLGEVSEGGAAVLSCQGSFKDIKLGEVTQWYLSEDDQIERDVNKTWKHPERHIETLYISHPPMIWAHIDSVGRVVRSVASSKVAMMMWLWQHSHVCKHGTREVTFTLRFEDVCWSSGHRTSLFWKQVSRVFTLCFHPSTKGPPVPFCSLSTQEFLFLTETKGGDTGPALRWGGVNRGTLMTRFNIHLRFLWHPIIEVCVFLPAQALLLRSSIEMMPWFFQVLVRFHFALVAVVSPTPPDQSIWLEDVLANFLVIYKLFTAVQTKHAPGTRINSKLPCNFSILISIQTHLH